MHGRCPYCRAEVVSRERRPDGNDTCAQGHCYPSRLTVPPDAPVEVSNLGPGVIHITCQADRITLTKDGQTVTVDADHFDTFAANVRAGGGA